MLPKSKSMGEFVNAHQEYERSLMKLPVKQKLVKVRLFSAAQYVF